MVREHNAPSVDVFWACSCNRTAFEDWHYCVTKHVLHRFLTSTRDQPLHDMTSDIFVLLAMQTTLWAPEPPKSTTSQPCQAAIIPILLSTTSFTKTEVFSTTYRSRWGAKCGIVPRIQLLMLVAFSRGERAPGLLCFCSFMGTRFVVTRWLRWSIPSILAGQHCRTPSPHLSAAFTPLYINTGHINLDHCTSQIF
jgi:hypothetical protein